MPAGTVRRPSAPSPAATSLEPAASMGVWDGICSQLCERLRRRRSPSSTTSGCWYGSTSASEPGPVFFSGAFARAVEPATSTGA